MPPIDRTAPAAGAPPPRGRRILVIDVAKGLAILAMVVYHFSWDLSAYQLIGADVSNDLGWRIFARSIAATFLFLVGVNLALANRGGVRPGPYARRLAIILGAALLVTVATWYLFGPNGFVFFGILHLIVVASLLAVPFLYAPAWVALPFAAFFLAGGHFLASPAFDGWGFYWLGLSTSLPASFDYVPVFPWFGVVLLGLFAGRLVVADPDRALWRWSPAGRAWRLLALAGRWSLLIYLVHQLILYPLVGWVAPLVGPSHAALMRQFIAQSETRCAVAGYPDEACQPFAQCLAEAFTGDAAFLKDYWHGRLSDDDARRFLDAEGVCQARFLIVPGEGAV
jgi:uncharacterized membrane protein